MSGPKTSKYILTPEQRKRIEEQQRLRREARAAQDKYISLCKKCSANISDIASLITRVELLCTESKKGNTELELLKQQYRIIEEEITLLSKEAAELKSLERLKVENTKLENFSIQIRQLRKQCLEVESQISHDYQMELSEIMASGIELSFAGIGDKRRLLQNPYILKINEAIKKLYDIDLIPELKDKFERLKRLGSEINSVDFLENFFSVQVCPFVRECEYYRENAIEYENLMSQYDYLVNETREPQKNFAFSEFVLDEIRAEIARLNQIVVSQSEQAYISEAIDEAMIEMGYELIGERDVTKKSGRKFHSELYLFDEGTAVNVTFSDSGQISMELGELDTTDRIPTESEAAALADDMRSFCQDYGELEKKLAKKGIVTKHVSLLPPVIDYAQVINITDYSMDSSKGNYCEKKTKKRKTKERKINYEV